MRDKNVRACTSACRKHIARLPPDLLWVEFYLSRRRELRANRGRKLAVYRHNLMEHLGEKSSFAVRASRPDWPKCFHPMAEMWSLAKTETFNVSLSCFACHACNKQRVRQEQIEITKAQAVEAGEHSTSRLSCAASKLLPTSGACSAPDGPCAVRSIHLLECLVAFLP